MLLTDGESGTLPTRLIEFAYCRVKPGDDIDEWITLRGDGKDCSR